MDLRPEDVAFRDELRQWLDRNVEHAADRAGWHRRLVDARWAVPGWPARFGGRDATFAQEVIWTVELAERDLPLPRNEIALFNIGPMLLRAGTAAQQERFLPPMVRADEIWCQGFSEPNAGSDLAALATRAELRDGSFVVNGQKTWTTFADVADLCLALVRTDPGAPKHRGISALVIDMHAPGVEVRPIREITGESGFNEVFFTDVVVPRDNVIGPLHGGWQVAMTTLAHERLGTMKLGLQLERHLAGVVDLARELDMEEDPLVRDAAAGLGIEVELMRLLTERALAAIGRGEEPGASLPLGKLQWSTLMQSLAELALRIGGPRAALFRGARHALPGDWAYRCVYARMTTIGAGTTEVQKNILAARELGLPRDAGAPPAPARPRDLPLDEARAALRASVRRFLGEVAPIRYVRSMLDDPRGTTTEVWRGLADLGLLGILIPAELGGAGLGHGELAVVLEELGRAVHPGPFLSSAVAAVTALRLVAGDTHPITGEELPLLAAGDRVATLALFEPTSRGFDWRAIETRAVRRGGEWRLDGVKIAPDAAAADLLLVTAAADGDGLGLFAVEAKDAAITSLPTTDATRKQAEVMLSSAPARRLDGGDARPALAVVLDRIGAALVADAGGAADRALELATEHAKVRVQFDRPIGAFQAVQHKLADMLREVTLARAAAAEALRLADGDDPAAFHRAATTAMAFASDALVRATADAIQVFGGIGFTWEHDAHLHYKRALSMQHALGGPAPHRAEYARLLFTPASRG